MKAATLLLVALIASCEEAPKEQARKPFDLEKLEREQAQRGVEEAAKYAAAYPSRASSSSAAETQREFDAFVDEERRAHNALQAARSAEIAAGEARMAVEDAAYEARRQHEAQMKAIEEAREEEERRDRLRR